MNYRDILQWLLEGDVAIQYQTHRDLLDTHKPGLQKRISTEGFGAQFLKNRNENGHWGRGFYQPKWTCTHYTLLNLKNLAISPENKPIGETLQLVFQEEKGRDGGINAAKSLIDSDVCVNGMVLNYACYFRVEENNIFSVIDFLLSQQMADGGFNCQSNRKGAVHSSMHSTLSVLEGILEFERNGYSYRAKELHEAKMASEEFILKHQIFRSHKTGKTIRQAFLNFCYPPHWYYDVLKALDYFQYAELPYDNRMDAAMEWIWKRRTAEGWWKLPAKHIGKEHFEMEKAGQPSRWNTLRALRVIRHFGFMDKAFH